MNSKDGNFNLEAIPEEKRLVRQAKAGNAEAFLQLYDAYGDNLYRYIYFRVMSDVAAEVIIAHVFRYAWEHLESYQPSGSPFVAWIYKIARNQVIGYCKGNVKTRAFDLRFLAEAVDYGLNTEGQKLFNPESWRNHLRLLTADKQQTLLQIPTLQVVTRYLEYLHPGRAIKPSPTFNAYTRAWLTRYLRFHTYRVQKPATYWRTALIYAVLILALLVTGTAEAQSAMPGDMLYGWKRTSEQAWRSLSPDPVGTDIVLANRRLHEWIAVQKDAAHKANASNDYFEAVAKLQPAGAGEAEAQTRILPVLRAQRQVLNNAGISSTQLDNYLSTAANPTPGSPPTQVAITGVVPTGTGAPTKVAGPATAAPTESAPPATSVPTEVIPTSTEVPTEAIPTATAVPTQVIPTATAAPTEVIPPTTEVPTEVVQPATAAPTQVAPPATVAVTEIPLATPTDTNP